MILEAIAAFRNRVANVLFNPASLKYHEWECNTDKVVFTAAANATATQNGADQINTNHNGVILNINTTVFPAAGSVTYKLQGKDASGNYYDVPGAVTAAISANGPVQLAVYPALTPAANAAISFPLPAVWRVVATLVGGGALSASVAATSLI